MHNQECHHQAVKERIHGPSLYGAKGEAAAATIEKENPLVNAIVILEGTPTTRDFRCDRVWVWVNDKGVVTRTPIIT
ncbi:putative proteinase inhibitor I13, potato inhibitor I [Helianthus annuus]|nr:putative proteinase inhibitor I13, potato inhibitor I [Helianthus annuus]